MHDSWEKFSLLGSFVTEFISNSPLIHCWVEIQTENNWYCAQFEKDFVLRLTKHDSMEGVSERGKLIARNEKNKKITVVKGPYRPRDRNMGEVLDFMMRYDGKYNLASNNCQHFGKKCYSWI
jgi:hypothetical protein